MYPQLREDERRHSPEATPRDGRMIALAATDVQGQGGDDAGRDGIFALAAHAG